MRIPHRRLVVAAVAAVAGIVLRVAVVASRLGPVDADEAVVGLMAQRLLHGQVEAFYWGQEYGGIHEQVLVAALLLVRLPGWLAMEVAPIAWSAAAAVLTWRIGRRLTGNEWTALLAGAFVWTSSGAFVWLSTKERGFYGAVLVSGLAALLFALRLVQRASDGDGAGDDGDRRRGWDALGLGLALGTGWYASPLVVHLALPAALMLVPHVRRIARPRLAGLCALGAFTGALPWIAVNVRTGFASLDLPVTLPSTTYQDRLTIFFRHALPIASGSKVPFSLAWLMPAARLAYGAFLVAIVVLAVLAIIRRRPTWCLAAGVLAYPFLYAAFPTSYYFGDPRYVYLLWPMLALVLVDAAVRWHTAAATALVVAAAAVGVVGLVRMASLPWTPDQATHDIAPLDIEPAVDALERSGHTRVYADYWLSYRITFASDGDVVAAPVQLVRSEREERIVASAAKAKSRPVPYVLVAGSCYERQTRRVLDAAGSGYSASRAGRVAIIHPIDPAARSIRSDLASAWATAC